MSGRDELRDKQNARSHASDNGGASAAPGTEPFAVSLEEFIAVESESPMPLLGDEKQALLTIGGLLLLFAKGGRGKTTLTIDAIFHLASGIDWLGFKVGRPLRILIIENEGPREPFRQKLAAKCETWEHEITGAIFIHVQSWGKLVLSADAVPPLRDFIEANAIDLVVGDPLDTLGIKGVGSPEDTREFMKLLVACGLTDKVSFWLLHHSRKAGAEDELDEVSGAWGGRADSLVKLDKLERSRSSLSFPKVRWSRCGNLPGLVLAFNAADESFVNVGQGGDRDDRDRDYVAEIERLLSDGKWRTIKEIKASRKSSEPGIGAAEEEVKTALTDNPDRFVSRTGQAAVEVGRKSTATVWSHVPSGTEGTSGHMRAQRPEGGNCPTALLPPPLKGGRRQKAVPQDRSELPSGQKAEDRGPEADS